MTAIRLATSGDARALGTIGPAIYAECYGHMWDDVLAFTTHLESFGTDAVTAFMQRAETRVWVVEVDSVVGGFLTLVLNSPDPITRDTSGAEVPRIYLLSPMRGLGIGLLAEAETLAANEGATHLWLDAMEAAPWAWKTYQKWGFQRIGATEFSKPIGTQYRSMVVMRRAIPNSNYDRSR